MQDIKELKLVCNKAYLQCKKTQSKLRRIRKVCERINKQYKKEKEAYEDADYKLALLDERFKKCKNGKEKKDEGLLINLNKPQILAIAEALGITLDKQEGGEEIDE